MKKYITKYKGLAVKELTLAYKAVQVKLNRVAHKAALMAESQLDAGDDISPAVTRKIFQLDMEMDDLQLELDTIGMMKTGRIG